MHLSSSLSAIIFCFHQTEDKFWALGHIPLKTESSGAPPTIGAAMSELLSNSTRPPPQSHFNLISNLEWRYELPREPMASASGEGGYCEGVKDGVGGSRGGERRNKEVTMIKPLNMLRKWTKPPEPKLWLVLLGLSATPVEARGSFLSEAFHYKKNRTGARRNGICSRTRSPLTTTTTTTTAKIVEKEEGQIRFSSHCRAFSSLLTRAPRADLGRLDPFGRPAPPTSETPSIISPQLEREKTDVLSHLNFPFKWMRTKLSQFESF